jgi:hypothetical protein
MRVPEEPVDLEKFRLNPNKPILGGDEAPKTVSYDPDGHEVADSDSPSCLCKKARYLSGLVRYWVKFAAEGPNRGLLVDPDEESDGGRKTRWTARGWYEFRAVSEAVFDFYLRFLQTKNRGYLRQAERAVRG